MLERGRILARGTVQEVKKDPFVIQAYLGDRKSEVLLRTEKLSRESKQLETVLSVMTVRKR